MTTALGDPNTSETITAANGQVSKPFIVKKYDGTELFSIDKDGNAAVPLSSFVTAATVKAALGAASSGVDGYLSGSDFTTFASKAAGDHDHDSAYSAASHAHAGSEITSGTIDGDVLPAMSTTKKGAVPASTTNTGSQVLYDNGWAAAPTGGGGITPVEYIITNESGTYKAYDGADGSVVTSNAAAATVFQYCADALTTGGTIVVKPGTYAFVTAVTFSNGTFIHAEGVTFDVTGLDAVVFTFGVANNAGLTNNLLTGIRGAYFYGDADNTSCLAIRINQACYGAVVDKVMCGWVANGIMISGACYNAIVRDCVVNYYVGFAVKLDGWFEAGGEAMSPNDAMVDHLETQTTEAAAIAIDITGGEYAPYSCVIRDCWIEGGNIGIRAMGSLHRIHNNYVLPTRGTDRIGILLSTSAVQCKISDNIIYGSYSGVACTCIRSDCEYNRWTVSDNHFMNIMTKAIEITDTYYVVGGSIIGNWFFFTATADVAGIYGPILHNAITGNFFNGTGPNGYGIQFKTYGYNSVVGNRFRDLVGGIYTAGGTNSDNNVIVGNGFVGCTAAIDTTKVRYASTANNQGYVNKASGSATITSGQAAIAVTHGLAATPTKVTATGTTADTNALYVDTVGATTFTINAAGNVGGNRTVYWYAEV